jgi:hypothetical protein
LTSGRVSPDRESDQQRSDRYTDEHERF